MLALCELTGNHPQHEDYCERKISVIMTTRPEITSVSANYLKRNGWPSNVKLVIVERLLPEAFANWLEYMRKEEKRVGILFPAVVKFSFFPHISEYVDYGWDKKYFWEEVRPALAGKEGKKK